MSATKFTKSSNTFLRIRNIGLYSSAIRFNCYRASFTKTSRANYVYTFPTLLVFPDGTSITVRYKEPRQIIKLPVDTANLTESEKKHRLLARRGTVAVKRTQDVDVDFDVDQYKFLWNDEKK